MSLLEFSDVWYVNAAAVWLVPIKHCLEYGVFRRFLLSIRESTAGKAPFACVDDNIIPYVTLTSEFNRDLKYLHSNNGVLPTHTMEDVSNVIEVTLPLALATTVNGR